MHVLIRLAPEINTKSPKIKSRFLRRLLRNMKIALDETGRAYQIHEKWSRIFVELESKEGLLPLSRVFGIGSLSPVLERTEPDLEVMKAMALELFRDQVAGRTFSVRAKRTNVAGITSIEVERELGAVLAPFAKRVDLKRPEVRVEVELREDGAYFFSERIPGPGGLPLGVEGRALCLISGGFDSAYAAWLMMKRGVELDFAFFNLAGQAYERSVLAVIKGLIDQWGYGYQPVTHVVDFHNIVDAIREHAKPNYAQVVLKRAMYKVANRLAAIIGDCPALITGECVGQVSSQTLHNLAAIDEASDLLILRPLIAFEKDDIIQACRRIGTYLLSEHIQEYCSITPRYPVTKGETARVRAEEEKIDPTLYDEAVASKKTVRTQSLDDTELVTKYLFTEEVPSHAEVIDCRAAHQFEAWHYPNAQHMDLDEIMASFDRRLAKPGPYVLYCAYGLQTAVVAEKMQKAGYEAYSFKGGSRVLRSYLERQDQKS